MTQCKENEMRGILIDPFTRSVSEIETSGKLLEIYELLGVDLITAVSLNENQSLFLDDEGLMVPKANQEYWNWKGSNQPYAGRGLILGLDSDGDNVSTTMSGLEVAALVSFLDKEDIDPDSYLGFEIFTW
jgi:hypothetical protein